MSESITIHLKGELYCEEQEGGYCSDGIIIGGEHLDMAIAKALNLAVGDNYGAEIDAGVGRCELTLIIWPDRKMGNG